MVVALFGLFLQWECFAAANKSARPNHIGFRYFLWTAWQMSAVTEEKGRNKFFTRFSVPITR